MDNAFIRGNMTLYLHVISDTCINNVRNKYSDLYKNSSRDEIVNVNFYAVRPEATRTR